MRTPQHKWTDEEMQFIKDNIEGTSYARLQEMFNKHFELRLTGHQIKGALARHKLKNNRIELFKKGNVSHNKGKLGLHYSPKTEFKKGHIPANHKVVGSERITKDGYIEIKTAEPNKWKLKHRIVWQKANGEMPDGHALIFADGNRENLSLDNLVLVSRSQLLVANSKGLLFENADLSRAGIMVAKVIDKTRKIKRGGNND